MTMKDQKNACGDNTDSHTSPSMFLLTTVLAVVVPDPLPWLAFIRCFTSAGVRMGGGQIVSIVTAFLVL